MNNDSSPSATPEDERSISVEKARDLLGEWGQSLSDHQIQRALDLSYFLAAKTYEDYMAEDDPET